MLGSSKGSTHLSAQETIMPHSQGPRRGRRRARIAVAPALLLGAVLLGALLAGTGARAAYWFASRPMPEFSNQSPQAWINTRPLTRADLAGKVVLIEVFTSS
jgi:hypothetical protein